MKSKNILINILLLLAVLTFFLLLSEITLSIIKAPTRIQDSEGQGVFIQDQEITYKLKSNFNGEFNTRHFNTQFSTNSQGFRNRFDFNPSDKQVIFMLGDSFTMGHGVEEDETFSSRLQYSLDNNYKIYNLGVGGYSQKQYVKQLEQLLPIYKPEVIIMNFFTGNDIQENCGIIVRSLNKEGLPGEAREMTPVERLKKLIRKSKTSVFIYEKTVLPFKKSRDLQFYIKEYETDETIECYQTTKRFFSQIKNLSSQYNSKLLFTIIGAEKQTTKKESEELLRKHDNFELFRINEKINNICQELEIDCIDLTLFFKERDEKEIMLYLGDGHWNPQGHTFASDKIAQHLIKEDYLV